MTNILTAQRVNLGSAWAGALIALACELQPKALNQHHTALPVGFAAVLAAILILLLCLHNLSLSRGITVALCSVLGASFTTFSLFLVAGSSLLW